MSFVSSYIFQLFCTLSNNIPYLKNLFRLLPIFISRSDKRSMDFLGRALEDYYSDDLKSPFVFYRHCLRKKYITRWEFDLGLYFRNYINLFPLEKKLIEMCYGNILDIGTCTGYYFPYLMDKGPATGIEISPRIFNLARKLGIKNCILGDMLSYKFNKKFDTIILFGHDAVLSGTLFGLRKMLKRFRNLLNENGQILLIIRHIRTLKYWKVVFTPRYDGQFGIPFKCLFLNVNFFRSVAFKCGFHSTTHGIDESTGILYCLVRLIKSS
ncbi:MAG: class I SAM-dependent methyltransferase [Promethearchaeota archaeon]